MIVTHPDPPSPGLVRVVLGGATLGASFTLAEVTTGYLTGGIFPVELWVFLATYASAALAGAAFLSRVMEHVGSGFLGTGGRRLVRGAPLALLVFVQVAVVINQEVVRDLPLVSGKRLLPLVGALLLAFAVSMRGLRILATPQGTLRPLALIVLPFPLVLASHLTAASVHGRSPLAAALLLVASVFLALTLAQLALTCLDTPRRSALFATVASLAVASVCFRGLAGPELAPYYRDQPQPRKPVVAESRRPNVVLVVLDTLRAQNLSCYGYPRPTSPRIDAFAREAVRYAHALTTAPSSLPGHASLFTGLYASHHGAHGPRLGDRDPPDYAYPLADRFQTLAEILDLEGYATSGIVANFAALSRSYNADRGFRHYDARPSRDFLSFGYQPILYRLRSKLPYSWVLYPMADAFPTPFRPAEEITDLAASWLARRPRERPYFLFVNYLDPHSPYAPRDEFRKQWAPRSRDGRFPPDGLSSRAFHEVMAGQRPLAEDERAHLIGLYDGAIAYLDHHLGRLLETLKRQEDYERTWVIVTSDHGEALGEHGHLEHSSSLYEEQVRVPLIVRFPGSRGPLPGSVESRPAQLVDVVPTILEDIDPRLAEGLDGISLLRPRNVMLAESFIHPGYASLFPGRFRREIVALVDADGFKYVTTTGEPDELYALAQDPGEGVNLATTLGARTSDLGRRVLAWKASLPPGRPRAPGTGVTPENREALRALGYLGVD